MYNKKRKAIFFDIDGTLLASGEEIHESVREALKKVRNHALTRQCRECRWLFACNGECPRNRFVRDRYGNSGHNYLCEGYARYFSHVAPYMDFMKAELDAGRAPANVMGARIGG